MSAPRKVEIHEHTEKNWMDRTIEQIAPYRRAILGLALAAVVGIVAIMLLSNQNKQKQERAWDNYFSFEQITPANEDAARKMITELGNTDAALMLKLKLAQHLQREGTQLLFSDKKTGIKKVTEAKENFTAVAAGLKNQLFVEAALFGAAMCEESLGKVKEAITAYEQQLQKFPQGMYSKIAADNLELLKSKSSDAVEWYTAFNETDLSVKKIDPVPDFGKRPSTEQGPGSGLGLGTGMSPGSGIGPGSGLTPGSGLNTGSGLGLGGGLGPNLGTGPALDVPGSLMPAIDPALNPLGTGAPSSTIGFPDLKLPTAPAGTEIPAPGTPAKEGAATPENPLPSLDGKSPATTTPMPEKPAEPAKAEAGKTEPAKK